MNDENASSSTGDGGNNFETSRLLDELRDSVARLSACLQDTAMDSNDAAESLGRAIEQGRVAQAENQQASEAERRRLFETTMGEIEAQFHQFKEQILGQWNRFAESAIPEPSGRASPLDTVEQARNEAFKLHDDAVRERQRVFNEAMQRVEQQFQLFTDRFHQEWTRMAERAEANVSIARAQEEIERATRTLEEQDAAMQSLLNDDNTDVSSLIRKRAELNELRAYLNGLRSAVSLANSGESERPPDTGETASE